LSAKDDELNNQLFIQIIVGEDRAKIFAAFAGLDHGKKPSDLLVVRATDKNKRKLWLEVKLDYLQLYNDNTILANIYDITQQKNIEISLRESEERLHQLSSQLLTAQEVERKRLALDLHDGIGQSLSAIKYSIENIVRDSRHRESAAWLKDMDNIVHSIRGTIEDTRAMAMNLRPSILDDLGVVSAIHWCCNRFKETYKHIQVESDITLEESDIEDNKKIVIYRIIQESLNNVSKHSGATEVRITLGHEDDLATCLRIADNGRGIAINREGTNYRNNGMGLNSIQERAQLTGGVFNLLRNRPNGTIIEIKWDSPNRFS
jgi:signal transduction histidine kinase